MTARGIADGIGYRGSGAATLALVAMTIAGCKPPPSQRWPTDPAAIERGRVAIERVRCAACHDIPGIDWPKGLTGPSLDTFGDRGLIAGSLPNRPDVLADFIRNAPAVKPGSSMPPMPVSRAEARDIAAYLYESDR